MDGVALVEGDEVSSGEAAFREGEGDFVSNGSTSVGNVDESGDEGKIVLVDPTQTDD